VFGFFPSFSLTPEQLRIVSGLAERQNVCRIASLQQFAQWLQGISSRSLH